MLDRASPCVCVKVFQSLLCFPQAGHRDATFRSYNQVTLQFLALTSRFLHLVTEILAKMFAVIFSTRIHGLVLVP